MISESTYNPWIEYDMVAEWCAKRGLKGTYDDPLPELIGAACYDLIMADVEAFEERVKSTAYMLAMERREGK